MKEVLARTKYSDSSLPCLYYDNAWKTSWLLIGILRPLHGPLRCLVDQVKELIPPESWLFSKLFSESPGLIRPGKVSSTRPSQAVAKSTSREVCEVSYLLVLAKWRLQEIRGRMSLFSLRYRCLRGTSSTVDSRRYVHRGDHFYCLLI